LHACFEALTAFSIFLQFGKSENDDDRDDLHHAVNATLNNMNLIGSSFLMEKLRPFEDVGASRQNNQKRIELLEDLRREVRDEYRRELGLRPIKGDLHLTYWGLRKRTTQ